MHRSVAVLVSLNLTVSFLSHSYAAQEPDLDTVLSRASEYVQSYARELGMVIAREEYVQRMPVASVASLPSGIEGNIRAPMRLESHERQMVSDYMMVRLPSEGDHWIGFRAVVEVDGRPIPDRVERLQELFEGTEEEAVERWRKLSRESARYNIGAVNRNTNVPTFALLVLGGSNPDSFEFARMSDDRVEGLDVWVVSYQEVAAPTLITGLQGEDVFIHGRLWIDPEDGRVVRTEVQTGGPDRALRSNVTVRYRPNTELGMWVPLDMKERYEVGDTEIEAVAKYSNFQRFNVNVSVDTSVTK
jgi:hypothetical protein